MVMTSECGSQGLDLLRKELKTQDGWRVTRIRPKHKGNVCLGFVGQFRSGVYVYTYVYLGNTGARVYKSLEVPYPLGRCLYTLPYVS